MNINTDSTKLTKLQELDSLLPREICGQSHALPRIGSAVRRGELGLTKPGRPSGSFLLLGPTGVGKTETVVVMTNPVFGAGQLFRFCCQTATAPRDENLEANSPGGGGRVKVEARAAGAHHLDATAAAIP